MLALFNNTPPATFDASLLETYASHISKTGIVIVRAGEHGSLTVRGAGERIWLTPYYKSGAPEVIDPTGAGNAFLGGFMHGWKKTGDLRQASAYGNVAASFAVEQVGLPRFKSEEYWNGVRVGERLERYGVRLE
jgi:sugar/nucleoside kinase (ribokinase family)